MQIIFSSSPVTRKLLTNRMYKTPLIFSTSPNEKASQFALSAFWLPPMVSPPFPPNPVSSRVALVQTYYIRCNGTSTYLGIVCLHPIRPPLFISIHPAAPKHIFLLLDKHKILFATGIVHTIMRFFSMASLAAFSILGVSAIPFVSSVKVGDKVSILFQNTRV